MILKAIVIDDEPLAVELMSSYVRKTPFLSLAGAYGSATSAYNALMEQPVDLVVSDIQMPGLNGMELSRMLPENTKVIFTTAFSSYAVEGFRVNAIDYLLKPVSYNDFLTAGEKALAWFEMKRNSDIAASAQTAPAGNAAPKSIIVKSEYRLQQIELSRIVYIEGLKDYVKIYVEGEDAPVLSLMSMKQLEEQLPSDMFIRVHRSYIVQPSKIRTIERNRIIFGEDFIPISDNYREAFFHFLSSHSIVL